MTTGSPGRRAPGQGVALDGGDQLKDYNRPGSHPDDSDTTELVTTGRARLSGEDGTLNDKLVGAAA